MLNCVNSSGKTTSERDVQQLLTQLVFPPSQLFDRIGSQVMSSRTPPGDGITRCRDAVDAIQSATSHKYSRDKAELVHLLGSPHFQVSDELFDVCYTTRARHVVSPPLQRNDAKN